MWTELLYLIDLKSQGKISTDIRILSAAKNKENPLAYVKGVQQRPARVCFEDPQGTRAVFSVSPFTRYWNWVIVFLSHIVSLKG